MWGTRAATLSDFGRYTDALRKQKIKTMLAGTSLTTFPREEVKQVLDFLANQSLAVPAGNEAWLDGCNLVRKAVHYARNGSCA
jgi:hypothetical protein